LSILPILERAQRAARDIRTVSAQGRNHALECMARAIKTQSGAILEANAQDLKESQNLSSALTDRLRLDQDRLDNILRALDEVAAQADPLAGQRELGRGRSGIRVTRRRTPLGVIAIVYEARPNVTAECAALTIKSGNSVVLRGGKEARHSNLAIAQAVRSGLKQAQINPDAVVLIEDTARETVQELLQATGHIDLVIPRGGAGLMKVVDQYARVPVIRHGQGICHVYIDSEAEPQMAIDIAFNAKVDRPGVCNALETLLIHEDRLDDILIPLAQKLSEANVKLIADEQSQTVLSRAQIDARMATLQDWDTEFLALSLAVKTVTGMEQACDHIDKHGTNHTASIVTQNEDTASYFLKDVDASCVMWNASTRFNDGGELGLGAEMGISTSKMHAYGPMSVNELTTEKLVVYGTGQVRGGN
jgi:glutamate-5-semialdehyde dehydrogenase